MNGLFLALGVCLYMGTAAQNITISGSVRDADSKAALGLCSVLAENTGIGTRTAINGSFSMNFPLRSTARLIVSCLGYHTDTILIDPNTNNYFIYLKAKSGLLNEVVVTGVSGTILLRENPVAISNVSSKAIDRTIEPNIIDALVKNVPGLNAVKTGPNISKPFIRGLGYNRVLTLYDGIRQEGQQWGDEHGIEVDAYNMEKAEIIKGPASLMFGSDAVAGVVSLFPYLPKEKDGQLHGRVLSEYQTNNGLIGNGLRLSQSNTKWLWIVKGSYRMAKNYTNSIDGRVYNTSFKEANAAATIGYTTEKGSSSINGTLYDNLQGIPDGSRDSLTRKFTKQVDEGTQDDINTRPVVTDAALNSYALSPLRQHIQHYRLYSNNQYRIGSGEVSISLGFQQNIRREYSHPSSVNQPGLFVRLNTVNYGLRYNTALLTNFELTVGANGMYQNNKSKSATDFPIPDYHLLDIGTYVYGKWKQNKLSVTGGLRYDTRQLRSNDFYTGVDPISGFGKHVLLPDTAGATLQFAALNKHFNGISLSIGMAYQLCEQINIKANIARGYRSPNITEIASNGLDPGAHIVYLGNRNFMPEFSFQQDVGLSANTKNLSASLSIFNNNIDNYIYLTQLVDAGGNAIIDAQGNKTFQYQQAAAQLYGLEAYFDIHPHAWAGFTFINSLALTRGISKKEEHTGKGINGEYLSLIPPAKWLSSIGREIKPASGILASFNWKIELEHNAAQNRYLALYNTETATGANTLFNLSVGAQIKYAQTNTLQLLFQINNLFDAAYQSHLSRLKYFEYYNRPAGSNTGMYNMGRNICMKVLVGF